MQINKPFKRYPHKMVKHTQTRRRQQSKIFLNVFDYFVWLMLKGLMFIQSQHVK